MREVVLERTSHPGAAFGDTSGRNLNAMEFLIEPNAKGAGASTRLHFVSVIVDILDTEWSLKENSTYSTY